MEQEIYICPKCQLTFDSSAITSIDEQGRDLCPACNHVITDADLA